MSMRYTSYLEQQSDLKTHFRKKHHIIVIFLMKMVVLDIFENFEVSSFT